MVYHSQDDEQHLKNCVLCRSEKLGKSTLRAALTRQVSWPSPKTHPPKFDLSAKTATLEEAFASIFNFMKTTCTFCKRYYRGCPECSKIPADIIHTKRFHNRPILQDIPQKNLNPRAGQDIQIVADPGTYSVTSGVWGKECQQLHVVKLNAGEMVSMDLVV